MRGIYLSAIPNRMKLRASLSVLASNAGEISLVRNPTPLFDSYVIDSDIEFGILLKASVEGWYIRGTDYFYHSDHYSESIVNDNTSFGISMYTLEHEYDYPEIRVTI